ncbi:hypothetical protein ACE193_11275 [Bernardetia sp. OM2101]|uniref:hypothetical protein n=1 Tax=Bernardetia sp. OM2101 TaxID=3344876 RepID=UPI0035CFD4AC
MILINEILFLKSLDKRRKQLRLIERTLSENNFDKYSIYRCLWIFDDIRRGFFDFRGQYSSEPYNNFESNEISYEVIIEEKKIIFKLSNLYFDTESLINFLSKISKETTGSYEIEFIEKGFEFEPDKRPSTVGWFTNDLQDVKIMCLKHMRDNYISGIPPKPRNEYNLLRAMTATNTKLYLRSESKNRVNLTIELSTL